MHQTAMHGSPHSGHLRQAPQVGPQPAWATFHRRTSASGHLFSCIIFRVFFIPTMEIVLHDGSLCEVTNQILTSSTYRSTNSSLTRRKDDHDGRTRITLGGKRSFDFALLHQLNNFLLNRPLKKSLPLAVQSRRCESWNHLARFYDNLSQVSTMPGILHVIFSSPLRL